MTLEEQIKIVLIFMGWTKSETEDGIKWFHPDNINFSVREDQIFKRTHYHSDWNWLHSAWNKFRDLPRGDFDRLPKSEYLRIMLDLSEEIAFSTTQEVFTELADAIQWYNKIIKL